jgi:phage-related protein (TIGR01555 family)
MIDLLGRKRRRKEAELRERELELAEKTADIEDRKLKQQRTIIRMMQDEQLRASQKDVPVTLTAPALMPDIVPASQKSAVAMDSCQSIYEYASIGIPNFYGTFPGYPVLAAMSQSSDYRAVAETTATEMTREWGRFKIDDPDADSGSDLTDSQLEAFKMQEEEKASVRQRKINQINDAFEQYGVRNLVRRAVEVELGMGRAQIYIKLNHLDDKLPFLMDKVSVKKGDLKGFRLIEPMWSTPSVYNANDPTEADFYVPTKWYVLGKEVHADRLMTLVMRPVPDILKPAYNFGGISMFQLMKPYVERYQRTADSVAQIVQAFSLTILSTDMSGILTSGESDANLWLRAGIFNRFRENSGMMLLDKESEEIDQINTPLTSLPELLTKSQEQMAGPSHTPLVKLVGVTPGGLNADSDGEIRVWYDYIMAQNEAHVAPIIKTFSDLIQLNLFGEIDPAIKWEFNPLYQLNELELAQVQEAKGRNAKQLVEAAIVSPQEARVTLSKDEQSPFNGIDVDDVPEGQGLNSAYDDSIDNEPNTNKSEE